MAGYCEFSKSNNAIDAENAGMLTASAIAKRIGHGATAAGVSMVMEPSEWHHTSCRYNETNYYDFAGDMEEARENNIDLTARIIEASKSENQRYRADVEWLEWSGTRKHPTASKHEAKNIEVEESGDWYIFHFEDGSKKRKKIDSTGTWVVRLGTW